MDTAMRAAGMAETSDPTVDPSRDVELGQLYSRRSEAGSRVSLPGPHQRTVSTATNRQRPSSTNGTHTPQPLDSEKPPGEEEDTIEESAHEGWNFEHPCWPHLNPHVPVGSPLYESTRIIRISRDATVAGDLAPTFSVLYPEILEPLLPEHRFRDLVAHINEEHLRIFDPYRGQRWLDLGLGVLTGFLWDDLRLGGIKKELAKLERWIEDWNRTHGQPPEFRIIPLQRTAYMSIDIQVPDPQIGPDTEPTEVDTRSIAGSQAARSSRTMSLGKSSAGRSQSRAKSEYSGSVGHPTDDAPYGAYPVVPPIPGKYLQEAQRQVSKQSQTGPKSPRLASPTTVGTQD